MIPTHETDGRLPAGIHDAGWTDIVERFGGTARRQALLTGLRQVLTHLSNAGVPAAYVAGSFVSTKPSPKDVDVCWEVTKDVDVDALHPAFWGPDGIPALLAWFGCHCFPASLVESATGETFLEFFQHDRNGDPVGIIKFDLEEWT